MSSPEKSHRFRIRVANLFLVFTCVFSGQSAAQQAESQPKEPLNQWSGSSLGMKGFGFAPKNFFVGKIRPGLAADRAGLKPYDRFIRVGNIDLLKQTKTDLQEYLDQLAPQSKIKIVIGRREEIDGKASENEKRLEFELVTDSKAMADGWAAADLISRNKIVSELLEEREAQALLDDFTEKLIPKIRSAPDPRTAYELINEHLDDLDISHCTIIPKWMYDKRTQKMSGRIGVSLKRFTEDGAGRYFIVDMEPGGPAYKSAIQIGDQVISVNGIDLENSGRLTLAGMEQRHQFFKISAMKGETLRLAFRPKPDSKIKSADIKTDNELNAAAATRASVRVLAHQGKKIGYCRLWDLMTMEINSCLEQAIKKSFVDCDALIVDLRGRGGKTGVLTRIQKTIAESGLPTVGIIDKHTRSAKEVLAYRLKHIEKVILVGQKTAGAVTWSRTTRLPSGAGLRYPSIPADKISAYTGGISLEGKGVEPDIVVPFTLQFSAGADPLLNAAKVQAAKEIDE